MLPDNNPKLERLKIHVYKTVERSDANCIATFEVMFNPSMYSQHYENRFSEMQGLNTTAAQQGYTRTAPQELSLELLFDGTNTYKDLGKTAAVLTITQRVEEFIKLTVSMNGEIHQPNFLKIVWGDLVFDCMLRSVNVTYSLFNRGGKPLRAKLNTVFISDISNEKQFNKVKKSSPDLTHDRVVIGGDNLPLLAYRIYNNPSLYMQLAMFNKLDNFRSIKPGNNILFPPVVNE